MATERVITGRSYRIMVDLPNKVWDKISLYKKACDVFNDNGKDLQTTIGSITGITDSLTSASSTTCASANAIKLLNDKIVALQSNL